MKTRKRKSESAGASATESAVPVPAAPGIPETSSDSAQEKLNERISFYVDDKGMPQWDRLSPKTTDQLRSILADKDSQKKLGITEPVKEAHELGFDATEANALLDLLQMIKAAGAAKIFDVPHEITSRAFTDTELQRSKMVPPITKILNKWGPSLLKSWKDEIGAGIIFISVTNAQVQMMKHLDTQRKKSQPQAVREMPNRSVSVGAESKPKAPEPPKEQVEENPVLDALNASA